MVAPSTDDDDLVAAARLTVVFVLLYASTFVNVLVTKKRLLRQARRDNQAFQRYASPRMHAADRLNGNFLEWSPVFLGLLWSLAATSNLARPSVTAAWAYLGLRALYVALVLRHGVASDGMNKSLWISTMPAYLCLAYMFKEAIRLLLLL